MAIANAIVARAKNFAGLDSVPMFPPVISAFLWSELIIIQHQAADTESRYEKKMILLRNIRASGKEKLKLLKSNRGMGFPIFS
jgi:hypothetical protein